MSKPGQLLVRYADTERGAHGARVFGRTCSVPSERIVGHDWALSFAEWRDVYAMPRAQRMAKYFRHADRIIAARGLDR